MTRNKVLQSEALKKQFIIDRELPITITKSTYFQQRLNLFDGIYNSKNAFGEFCKMLENFNSEDEYFQYCAELMEKITSDVKASCERAGLYDSEFDKLVPDFLAVMEGNYPRELDMGKYDGLNLLSISLREDEFTAIQIYNPEVFNGAESWYDFISQYTPYEHLRTSGFIRNAVIILCLGIRQYQLKYLTMLHLFDHLIRTIPRLKNYVASFSGGEIVFHVDIDFDVTKPELYAALDADPAGKMARVELYGLDKLNGIEGYTKEFFDLNKLGREYAEDCGESQDRIAFVGVDPEILPQVVAYYEREFMLKDYLVINHNGHLAQMLEPVENPF